MKDKSKLAILTLVVLTGLGPATYNYASNMILEKNPRLITTTQDEAYERAIVAVKSGALNNQKEIIDALLMLANSEHPRALKLVSKSHLEGTPPFIEDESKGIFYLRKSANLGDAESMHLLGSTINYSSNPKNEELAESLDWYLKATNADLAKSAKAYINLAGFDKVIPLKEAFKQIENIASGDMPNIQYFLGQGYLTGEPYFEQDTEKGLTWIKLASKNGNLLANKTYASILWQGFLEQQNKKQAVNMWEEYTSIIKNDGEILIKLATAYEMGEGAEQDYRKALALYKRAKLTENNYDLDDKINIITEEVNCKEFASTTIFNIKIKCASSAEFDKELVKNKLFKINFELKNKVAYDSKKALHGSNTLIVEFHQDRLTTAEYVFNNKERPYYEKLKKTLIQQYGQQKENKIQSEWLTEDRLKISLSLLDSEKRISLKYSNPNRVKAKNEFNIRNGYAIPDLNSNAL
jgi:TPR repeat protein